MKTFLKKYIVPVWLWRDLRFFKKWKRLRRKSVGKKEHIKELMTFSKMLIKGRIELYEKLDFPSADIFLSITAMSEIGRLNACQKEPETVEWIKSNVKPGDVFYDVGANVGAYSFVFSAVAKGECQVYAFEPSFSTFSSLCKNIILNKMSNSVTPLQIALSNKTEIASFQYASIAPGASQHRVIQPNSGDVDTSSESKASHKMLSYSLDDFITAFKLPIPNHIKIDVDGTELEIVKGAKHTLSDSRVRSLLIEIDEELDTNSSIQKLLETYGFSLLSKHSRGGSTTIFNYILKKDVKQ